MLASHDLTKTVFKGFNRPVLIINSRSPRFFTSFKPRYFTQSFNYSISHNLALLFLGAVINFLVLIPVSWAESSVVRSGPDQAAALDETEVQALPEVLVESTKKSRSEKVQEIPIAMTVTTGETVEKTFSRDLTDIGYRAPNVQLRELSTFLNTAQFTIRGMGNNSSTPSDEPTVGVFVDGMYLGLNAGSLIDLFDVETVEVLRGPQGTLFGRNVTGGAVLIRHRRPTGQFSIRGATTYGSYDYVRQNLVVEGPVSDQIDTLAGKLGLYYLTKDGYFNNLLNPGDRIGEEDTWLIRPMLTWRPNPGVEATLITEFSHSEGDGPAVRLLQDKFFGTPPPSDKQDLLSDLEPQAEQDVRQVVLDINANVGPGRLTSITGYRDIDTFSQNDTDGTGLPTFHVVDLRVNQTQWSEELRYATPIEDWIEWTTGINIFYQYILNKSRDTAFSGAVTNASRGVMDHSAVGVFSQADLHFWNSLILTLGFRYTYEWKEVAIDSNGGGGCSFSPPFANCMADFMDQHDWNFPSGRVALSWFPQEGIMIYTSWVRSNRAGGYSLRNALPASPGPYDEEVVDAFEVGFKADWWQGRLRTNFAAFYNDYTNMQRTVLNTNLTSQERRNAAEATIKGFEFEVNVVPVEQLQIDGSIGFVDAGFEKYDQLDVNGDSVPDPELAKNLDLLGVPEFTGFLGGNYRIPLESCDLPGEIVLRTSASYTDSYALTETNALFQGSYTLVDSSITYFYTEHLSASVFGRNLFNEQYAYFGVSSVLFDTLWSVQPGRVFGGEVRYAFF